MSLFSDYNMPFAIALGIMALLGVLQVVGIGSFDADVDLDLDAGPDANAVSGSAGIGGAITTLLGLGRVPLLVWLIVFLLLFALIGLSIQAFAADLTGSPLYSWLAALFSFGASVPATSLIVRPLARIIPQDETTAVSLDSLVGRRAKITNGRSAAGYPARASVRDRHGHVHYVMVEPHEGSSEMHEGDELLIVRRDGQTFYGVAQAERNLSPVT
ncbi:YqiJ family protein [Pontixanthobacter luteolus]|uniref:YqiJ family protein n=1 Tax=Pontixanthobacter luteolus TaxID=295089 RepID=UPI002302A320|nr:YqiJ family protein [Pontixanthobacter luteolus]